VTPEAQRRPAGEELPGAPERAGRDGRGVDARLVNDGGREEPLGREVGGFPLALDAPTHPREDTPAPTRAADRDPFDDAVPERRDRNGWHFNPTWGAWVRTMTPRDDDAGRWGHAICDGDPFKS
jgi:hypothetical protein